MLKYTLLQIADVNTSNRDDFKYIFAGDPKYNRIGGSIHKFAQALGDPTESPKNSLYLGGNTINNLIKNQMKNIDTKIQSILNNPTELQKVKDHFLRNQECKNVHLYVEYPIQYPDMNKCQDLNKIIKHYIALQTKVGNHTIDEYIDRAVKAQEVIATNLKDVIRSFDPTWSGLDAKIESIGGYINAVNKSYQSSKYGIFEGNPFSAQGARETLLNDGLLNTSSIINGKKRTNYTGPDAFTGGYEIPFGMASTTIKMIIGLTYYDLTGLVVASAHEIGHELEAQSGLSALSQKAIDYVKKYMPPQILEKGYKAAPGKYVLGGCWGEHVADLIGILCAEGHIRTLKTNAERVRSIRGAMTFAHNIKNTIQGNHPPGSMRYNLILISRFIQDTLLSTMNIQSKSFNNLITLGGSYKKTRKGESYRKKYRKSTHRRRR